MTVNLESVLALPPQVRPRGALVLYLLVQDALRSDVHRVFEGFRVQLEFAQHMAALVNRTEASAPDALLVEPDVAPGLDALTRLARSLRPDVKLIAVTCFWSERDESLRSSVNAVVHKPVRPLEWRITLTRLGILPGASAPSELRAGLRGPQIAPRGPSLPAGRVA